MSLVPYAIKHVIRRCSARRLVPDSVRHSQHAGMTSERATRAASANHRSELVALGDDVLVRIARVVAFGLVIAAHLFWVLRSTWSPLGRVSMLPTTMPARSLMGVGLVRVHLSAPVSLSGFAPLLQIARLSHVLARVR